MIEIIDKNLPFVPNQFGIYKGSTLIGIGAYPMLDSKVSDKEVVSISLEKNKVKSYPISTPKNWREETLSILKKCFL